MASSEKGCILATKIDGRVVITYPVTTTDYVDGLSDEYASKAHTHSTVNGHTVECDVPADAKFTDTVSTWEEFVPNKQH